MNLDTIANISQIASATTIVGGTVFGLLQISEYRKQRRDSVAAELMRACGFVVVADDSVWRAMPAIVHPLIVGRATR